MHAGAPIPLNEARRLSRIEHLCVMEGASDPLFDDIVAMAADFFQAPIALVSIVDKHRQWFRARVGLEVRQTPRALSFCAYTILGDEPLEILDATRDKRFVDNGLVTGHPGIRYYAGAPLITEDGLRLGSLCIIDTKPRPAMGARDIAMLKRMAALVMKHIVSLRHNCYLDQASGLYNRERLEEDVRLAISSGLERRLVIADMFTAEFLSDVVKALGYAFAEELVIVIKERLLRLLPDGCLLYKVSPTRFGFLVSDQTCDEQLCRSLLNAFETAVQCQGIPVQMQLGIGVVNLRAETGSEPDWVRRAISTADDARDRQSGWERYQPRQDAARQRAFSLLSALTDAVRAPGQLRLVYQPRIDLTTGACTSVEALLRWTHPTLGPVGPAEFIPLAEKTALMRPLSIWVLNSAIEQAAAWHAAGLDLKMAINVTPQDLSGPEFTERMIALLDQHGISPDRFELEFTESALMKNPAEVRRQLERLRALGTHIAIDDFGTGYSNWSYLRQLPATSVKLDQSLMRNLISDRNDQRLVKVLIGLAKKMGYCVVAEGIETEQVKALLSAWGCHEGQGYLIARPLEVSALETWLGPRAQACRQR